MFVVRSANLSLARYLTNPRVIAWLPALKGPLEPRLLTEILLFWASLKANVPLNFASLEPSRNVSPKVVKSQFTCSQSSVDVTSHANHEAKKSNNPQNNSGLCRYVISEFQPFTLKIIERLSMTFTAKMKLLPSVFSSLCSITKIFVFAENSKRHFSIFVWFILGLQEKNRKSEVVFAVCRLP